MIIINKISGKWQVFFITSLGIFMATLDGSILNVANPTIAQAFGVNISSIQWVVTSYILVITSTLLFFGRLGDKIGGQKIYTYGFLIFTIGSLFCSLSNTLNFLIYSRIFQALGSSMMMATGMGIISNTFPPEERGKALGLTGTVVGIGNMSGPTIGGALLAHFQWPIIFWINIPVGILAFILGIKYLPAQPKNKEIESFDVPGILLFSLFTVTLLIRLSNHNHLNLGGLLFSLIIIIVFYYWEKFNIKSMLDFALFKIKAFTYGNLMALSAYSAQMSVLFLMPFYLENILHLNPAQVGLIITITPLSMAITAPLAGSLSDKIGSNKLLICSFCIMTASYLLLASLKLDSSHWLLYLSLSLLGIGMGSFGSPNNSTILGSIPPQKAGYGGGFSATVRNFAFALGIALSSSILTYFVNIKQGLLSYELAYVNASNMVYHFSAFVVVIGLLLSIYTKHSKAKSDNF